MSGLPSGATASFSPNQVDLRTATSSALTVTTSPTTGADQYTLIVSGVSGSLTSSTAIRLQVKRN
jgi:hypothetical protein